MRQAQGRKHKLCLRWKRMALLAALQRLHPRTHQESSEEYQGAAGKHKGGVSQGDRTQAKSSEHLGLKNEKMYCYERYTSGRVGLHQIH